MALQLLQQSGLAARHAPERSGRLAAGRADGLCELSSRDALTGLANRRQFELAMAREIDRVARAGEPALVLMIDIDHFKRVNDTHGHPAGDVVLRAVGQALHECIRPMDTVARFGGEEFAMILPNCPPAFGQTVAERVRTSAVAPGEHRARRRRERDRQHRRRFRAAMGAFLGARCGSSAPTSSSTGPSRTAATAPASRCRRFRMSAPRRRACSSATPVPGPRMSSDSATPPARAHPAVTSGKGGVGKTFVSANLAAALAQRGERVLVLDADLGLANLDVVLNLFPKITLHDVFTGKAQLEQAILPAPGGFSVMLAGSGLVEYRASRPR